MSCGRCPGTVVVDRCINCGWSPSEQQERDTARTYRYEPNHREPSHQGPKDGVVSVARAINTGCDVCKNPVTSGEHMIRCDAVWSRLQGRWVEGAA